MINLEDEQIARKLFEYIVQQEALKERIDWSAPYAFFKRGTLEKKASEIVSMFMLEHSLMNFYKESGQKICLNALGNIFLEFSFKEIPDIQFEISLGNRFIWYKTGIDTEERLISLKDLQDEQAIISEHKCLMAIDEPKKLSLIRLIDTVCRNWNVGGEHIKNEWLKDLTDKREFEAGSSFLPKNYPDYFSYYEKILLHREIDATSKIQTPKKKI